MKGKPSWLILGAFSHLGRINVGGISLKRSASSMEGPKYIIMYQLLLPSDPLITQMGVTFHPLKRSRIDHPRRGHSEGRGIQPFFNTIVFQIPCEDRCLDPQTPPEKAFRQSKHLLTRYLGNFGRLGIWNLPECAIQLRTS